ncbi:MAG TPA: PAS domain S-box protein, partial [Candidatus Brocadiaceae bacterium]|nr:PAS domain S-box protein [Candidatus Brocadiaceae bacterium]
MPNPFKKDKLLLWWLPAAIAIIGSIASFYCLMLLDNREHEYIKHIIRSDVSGLADKSARLMKERIFTHPLTDKIFFPTGVAIAFLTAGIIYLYQKKNRLADEIRAIARLPSENPHPVIRLAHDGKILFSNKAGFFILENCGCYTIRPCKAGDTVAGKWLEYINKALETNDVFKGEEVVSKHIFTLTFVPITEQKYVNVYGVDVTARRHIEEALATSEKRYRTLSEVSPVGIFYTDVEGKWVYVNKQIPVLTGMNMSETIGDGWMSALHPDDMQRVSLEWLKSISGRTGFSSEYRFVEPTGKMIWVYSQATPEKDGAGAVIGYVGTVTDITERRQTEEKLRKITESAFDAIIIIDENGVITYWNHVAETLFGYAKDEAIGKDVHTLIVPAEYASAYQHGMMRFKTHGTGDLLGKRVVLPALKKNGTQFYAEHSFAAFQSNNSWNAVSIIRDYTERKQYEEELKRLNETLEQRVAERTKEILVQNEKLVTLSRAVEQSSTCIVITDANGNIEYVNPQFIELTGYTLAEAKGQNPRILKSGQTPPERFKELWETITNGETWHGEFTNKKKNGEIYHELGTISPIKNAEGEITHFVAIKNDISGIKNLEAERKRLEDQLYHAQKLESIGKLAGGIAHDFNNMLMAVVGYSNLIEMELKEDNPLRNYTKKILDLTDKSKRLTQSLLTFGRRQPLYLSAVDLNDMVRDMEPLLFKAIGERIRCEMPLS